MKCYHVRVYGIRSWNVPRFIIFGIAFGVKQVEEETHQTLIIYSDRGPKAAMNQAKIRAWALDTVTSAKILHSEDRG